VEGRSGLPPLPCRRPGLAWPRSVDSGPHARRDRKGQARSITGTDVKVDITRHRGGRNTDTTLRARPEPSLEKVSSTKHAPLAKKPT